MVCKVVSEEEWKALAQEFYEMVKDTTKETAVVVIAENGGIEIIPAETNKTGTFFHTEELVDFCRCKGLDNHVSSYNNKAVAYIF